MVCTYSTVGGFTDEFLCSDIPRICDHGNLTELYKDQRYDYFNKERVRRNTGTHQNTGTNLYLPERTINIGFTFTYVWFYDFIIICMLLMC